MKGIERVVLEDDTLRDLEDLPKADRDRIFRRLGALVEGGAADIRPLQGREEFYR